MKERILITGGTGFIGMHLASRLAGSDLSLASNHKSKTRGHYTLDITNRKKLDILFSKERPEYIFHLAARINLRESMEKPASHIETNVLGTMNVLEMCRKYDARKIIFPSTAAVYGKPKYLPVDERHETLPISIYGTSKLVAEKYIEMYCRAYGIKYTILRYANVYGSKSRSVISIFIGQMKIKERPVIFGDGGQTRDYIYIDDVIDATVSAMSNADNLKLNVGTGKGASVKEIFDIISSQLRSNIKPVYKSEIKGEIKKIYLDISEARKHLKWAPKTDIDSGVRRIIGVPA